MDQGLKERLIGAAVLVALGVWLIPWVLDGEQEQVELDGSDASVQLPSPEEPLPIRSQTLTLGEVEPFADEAARNAAAEPAAAVPPASSPGTISLPLPIPAPESSESQANAPVEAPAGARVDAPPPAVADSPATREQPVAAATPAPAPAAAAPPKPTAATSTAARPDPKGDWVVQLGSFGEEANATRLAQRVSTFGYKPSVSSHRSNGRTMYRVRVGPYATRPQADATASALSAHGVKGQVVSAD